MGETGLRAIGRLRAGLAWKRFAINQVVLNETETTGQHLGVFRGRRNIYRNDAVEVSTRTDGINPSLHLVNVATKGTNPIWRIVAYKMSWGTIAHDNPKCLVYTNEPRFNVKKEHTKHIADVEGQETLLHRITPAECLQVFRSFASEGSLLVVRQTAHGHHFCCVWFHDADTFPTAQVSDGSQLSMLSGAPAVAAASEDVGCPHESKQFGLKLIRTAL